MSIENNNFDEKNIGQGSETTSEGGIQNEEVIINISPLFEGSAESEKSNVGEVSDAPAEEPAATDEETETANDSSQDDSSCQAPVHTSSSYEWSSDNGYEAVITPVSNGEKDKKKSSFSGFRAFLAIILSIFTVSVIAITVMVADYINDIDYGTDSFTVAESGDKTEKPSDSKDQTSSKDYGAHGGAVSANSSNLIVHETEADGKLLSIPQIAAKCSPSSVGVVSQVEVTFGSSFFPFSSPSTGISKATGSGFIYSSDGYIITNHHVIEDAKKITVVLHDKTQLEAELVGSDSLSDIAVLKVTPTEDITLIPMEIGNSDELVVGEAVVAIGCPAGIEFLGTVTDGIVSSINRDVQISENSGATSKTMTLIQTNATINQGNSGGPLINTKGQVIGINTLKLSSNYEGIGFSIPMNGAMPIISQLIEHGKVIERSEEDFAYGKGVIGINGSAISEDEAKYYGIPQGVLVVQINRESSAARAGLRRGDIITHYNGKKVATVDEINQAKGSGRAGETVTVTVYRDGDDGKGETLDITFKLDAQ